MEIYVNHKLAMLKKGTSFEYVAENRLFSGSDGYTLTITFPLRGCKRNLEIFGHINRKDVVAGKVIFDCEIRDKGFYKFGSITITEISDAEVKTQFLEGRSEQNFDETFDDIYINELDLGDGSDVNDSTPTRAWEPIYSNYKCVALPWVNDYSGNIQNLADYNSSSKSYTWNKECRGRSWQPYLLYITKKICEAVGYEYDFSKLEQKEEYKNLIICNTLPYAWYIKGFARALPHWTVAEYFEKLELFLRGAFTIDHRAQSIVFDFTEETFSALPPVNLDKVVNEHTVEVTVENDKCDYQETKNFVYKECDHEMWKYYSCDWYVKSFKKDAIRYNTLSQLLSDNKIMAKWNGRSGRDTYMSALFYAADVDTYFIIRSLSKKLVKENSYPFLNEYEYKMELRPVNMLGGRIVDDSEDANEEEIEFVPAWIDETDDTYGRCLFLSFSGYDDETASDTLGGTRPTDRFGMYKDYETRKKEDDEAFYQPDSVQTLEAGEETKKAEYYDRIYVAWWDGALTDNGKLPHPYVEDLEIAEDWSSYRAVHFSLRLAQNSKSGTSILPKANPRQKSTFKFLSDTIPNPMSVFYIKGKKYICQKITATFTAEHGLSQLLKGDFYPIID